MYGVEKRAAKSAARVVGSMAWTIKRLRACIAVAQVEGVLMLKVMRGWGSRERLVKEERVMARQSLGLQEALVVRMTTMSKLASLIWQWEEGGRAWMNHVPQDTAELVRDVW